MRTNPVGSPNGGRNELVLTPTDESETLPTFVSDTTSRDPPENLIIVVFTLSPDEVLVSLRTKYEEFQANLGIISVDEITRSSQSESGDSPAGISSGLVTAVYRSDYSRIVTIIDLYLREWDGQTRVYIGSLTPLLEDEEWSDVFRFLHLVTNRIRTHGADARYHVDPELLASHTLDVLRHLFDEVTTEPTVADTHPSTQISLREVINEALEPDIRMHIIQYLLERNTPVSVRRLAENLIDQEDIDFDEPEDVHLSLYHVHIPQLVEAGLVVTDEDHSAIEASKAAEQFESELPMSG